MNTDLILQAFTNALVATQTSTQQQSTAVTTSIRFKYKLMPDGQFSDEMTINSVPAENSSEDAEHFYKLVYQKINPEDKNVVLMVINEKKRREYQHLKDAFLLGIDKYKTLGVLQVFLFEPVATCVLSIKKNVLLQMIDLMTADSESIIPANFSDLLTDKWNTIRTRRNTSQDDPFCVIKELLLHPSKIYQMLANFYYRQQYKAEVESTTSGVQQATLVQNSGSWFFASDDNFTDLCLPNFSPLDGSYEDQIMGAPIRMYFVDQFRNRFVGQQINANTSLSFQFEIDQVLPCTMNMSKTMGTCYQVLKGLDYFLHGNTSTLPFIHPTLLETFLNTIQDNELADNLKYSLENYSLHFTQRITPKGMLFFGPPGTGKSYLCKQICEALGMVILNKNRVLDASRFLGGLSGDSNKNIYNETLKAKATPYLLCTVILDEVESVGAKRSSEKTEGHKIDTLNTLLTKISDTFEQYTNSFYLACTNSKESIEEALTRPGRIEAHVFIGSLSFSQKQTIISNFFKTNLASQFQAKYSSEQSMNQLLQRLNQVICKHTLNFTYAQLASILFKMEVYVRKTGDIIYNFDEILEQVILDAVKRSTDERLRYNKLYQKEEYDMYCKQYELDYFKTTSAVFDEVFKPITSQVATGNFIIYQSKQINNYLSSFISHEMAGKVRTVSLPFCTHLRQLVFFATNPIATVVDLQSIRIVDNHSMSNIEEEIDGHLKEIQQEVENQSSMMVIFFLDELVGYTASWEKSTSISLTANTSKQNLQEKGSTNSNKTSKSQQITDAYDLTCSVDKSSSEVVGTEFGQKSSSGVTKNQSNSTSVTDGEKTYTSSHGTSAQQSFEEFLSHSKTREKRNTSSNSLSISKKLDESFQLSRELDSSEKESITTIFEISTSSGYTNTTNIQMTHSNVFHTIMTFVSNNCNMDIKKNKKKAYIVLVTQQIEIYDLITNHMRWGLNPLWEHRVALRLSASKCITKNSENENYEYLTRCSNLKLIEIEYSVGNERGISYLQNFWNKPKYKNTRNGIEQIVLKCNHVDNDGTLVQLFSTLFRACKNLKILHIEHTSENATKITRTVVPLGTTKHLISTTKTIITRD